MQHRLGSHLLSIEFNGLFDKSQRLCYTSSTRETPSTRTALPLTVDVNLILPSFPIDSLILNTVRTAPLRDKYNPTTPDDSQFLRCGIQKRVGLLLLADIRRCFFMHQFQNALVGGCVQSNFHFDLHDCSPKHSIILQIRGSNNLLDDEVNSVDERLIRR